MIFYLKKQTQQKQKQALWWLKSRPVVENQEVS